MTKRIELQLSGWTHLKEDAKSLKLVIRRIIFYDHKNEKQNFYQINIFFPLSIELIDKICTFLFLHKNMTKNSAIDDF